MMTTRLLFDGPKLVSVLFIVLLGAEVMFVLADAVINFEKGIDSGPVRRFFNIAREDGLASWFAIVQTWMLGLTAALLYAVERARGSARSSRVGWAILAMFFLYMAMDDGTQFHERVGSWVRDLTEGEDTESSITGFFPSYTWQLVFLPMFGSFGLFFVWFLNRELTTTAGKLLVLASLGLLVLAVVLDFFEGMEIGHALDLVGWIEQSLGVSSTSVSHYSKSLEEFLEMFAMTLL